MTNDIHPNDQPSIASVEQFRQDTHARDTTFCPHPAGCSQRRGTDQPQAAAARWFYPASGQRRLFLSAARTENVLNKIADILRDVMNETGGIEMLMPSLVPAVNYCRKSLGGIKWTCCSRCQGAWLLSSGFTHEEVLTEHCHARTIFGPINSCRCSPIRYRRNSATSRARAAG